MSNPILFPHDGLAVKTESDQKNLGLKNIDRFAMTEAFGLGRKATAILKYVQDNSPRFKEHRGMEVQFEYTAKVLCIYQNGNVQPLTMSDLVNLGSAIQMFMGLIDSKEVKGNEGKENAKWRALAVHNKLQANKKSGDDSKDALSVPYVELPKMLQAKAILQAELYPKAVVGQEWKVKTTPTGAKRNELMEKIKQIDEDYEQVIAILFVFML